MNPCAEARRHSDRRITRPRGKLSSSIISSPASQRIKIKLEPLVLALASRRPLLVEPQLRRSSTAESHRTQTQPLHRAALTTCGPASLLGGLYEPEHIHPSQQPGLLSRILLRSNQHMAFCPPDRVHIILSMRIAKP